MAQRLLANDVVYSECMYTETSKDLFFLVLAIVTGGVGVFVCWAMYEVARMLHQANQLVTDTREKIERVEQAIVNIKERIESSASYLGVLAKGGKALMSHFNIMQNSDDDEDEEEDEKPRRRRR